MEKKYLSDSTIKLNKLCKTVVSAYRAYAQEALSEGQVISPTGMAVLTSLYNNPEGDTISSIAFAIDVSKGLVSREVEKLRKDGYVTTLTDENDRRMVRLKLKDETVPIIEREYEVLQKLTQQLISDMSEEDFVTFMNLGMKIQDQINIIRESE
jgi:DNA-binding MarR family transcriptional regulator